MNRVVPLAALCLAAAVAAVSVRAGSESTEAVPARPRTEQTPPKAETPAITPPAPLPDVRIPAIPEVGEDPFKPRERPEPGKGTGPLIEEGKRLFGREGRLEQDEIGRSVFVFDSGDRPIYLLENSWREFLEQATGYGKRFVRWRVSGVVTVYGKQNYLLLTKCVRVRAEEDQL